MHCATDFGVKRGKCEEGEELKFVFKWLGNEFWCGQNKEVGRGI